MDQAMEEYHGEKVVAKRLENAWRNYEDALFLCEAKRYQKANTSIYYALFHGLRAVMASDGYHHQGHKGVILSFHHHYIEEGIFAPALFEVIKQAYELRNLSDYEDFFINDDQFTLRLLELSKKVLRRFETYIENKERTDKQ